MFNFRATTLIAKLGGERMHKYLVQEIGIEINLILDLVEAHSFISPK